MDDNLIKSALFGFAVGDALGVPVEFKSREYLRKKPVTGMGATGKQCKKNVTSIT